MRGGAGMEEEVNSAQQEGEDLTDKEKFDLDPE